MANARRMLAGCGVSCLPAAHARERRPVKAVVCRKLGDPGLLAVEDVPPPRPRAGEVRVRLRAAGVNFPDLLMVAGGYQLKPPLPFVPGMEAAGEIAEVGAEVTGWRSGEPVIVKLRPGAFQQEVAVAPSQLAQLPAGLDFAEGAALLVGHVTAWHALVQRGRLTAGETVLVLGAGGGVGLAAVEVAARLGATVIAVAGEEARLQAAQARGARHLLDRRSEAMRERVMALTGGRGCDVVFDPVGGEAFRQALRVLAWRGRLLVIGFAAGELPELPANYPLLKGAAVIGVRAGEHARRHPEAGRQATEAVLRMAAEGVRPHISHRLPLERAADALALLRDRRVVGKAVLEIA